MIIPISEKRRIRSDLRQWIVDVKRTKKEGTDEEEEKWTSETFHMNVNTALKAACEQDIRDIPDALEFSEAMEKVREIFELYKNIMENVMTESGEKPKPAKARRTK